MNGATRIPSPPSSLTKVNRAVADEETPSNSAPSPSPRASKSQSDKTRKVITQRDCMLVVIGALLACSVIFSLSIGHQHHIQHDKSAATSLLQSRLKGFAGGEASGKPKTLGKQPEGSSGKPKSLDKKPQPKQQMDRVSSDQSGPDERAVFESIIERAQWTAKQCDSTPPEQRDTVKKKIKTATDLPMLPERGVAPTLERWLRENPSSVRKEEDYPICHVPPAKSCHVSTYTLIIMSHTTERLQAFMDPLASMIETWPGLTEAIIVWNSPRETLTKVANEGGNSAEKKYAKTLLQWNDDASHPLRIFFSLEEGLENNLLNRYHPVLKPSNEAVMYFDDDGPFWTMESMVYGGLELWKRNSNVQVGGFPRNVRFLSDRMKGLEAINLKKSIDLVVRDADGYGGETHPEFTPVCRKETADHVEYNYFSFPDFAGHVLLPSGTFLHRNYLCFIWHPAFEELRQWVVTHKTMPDDMTVSTLISHLAGRAPRTFPKEVAILKRRLEASEQLDPTASMRKESVVDADGPALESPPPDQSHRRLLWKQKGWGAMREEAINSILGYFGSIHPGTVGWCAGTPHMKNNNRGVPYVCHPDKPTLDMIPWLTEGETGAGQCPTFDKSIIEKAQVLAKKKADEEAAFFDGLDANHLYKDTKMTCKQRMQYLIDKYDTLPKEAKEAVIKEDAGCKK